MSELTRDEIRRACEAVGWPTKRGYPFQITGWPDRRIGRHRFRRAANEESDILALLEATGEDFKIIRIHNGPYSGYAVGWVGNPGPMKPHPTLPEAAVRAVLAWAKAKEAKG